MSIVALRPQLHLVQLAFGRVYLWQDGDELTLVDAGVPGSAAEIAAATRSLGLDPTAIRRIVLTHGHDDHYGSAAEIRSWYGAQVYAHREDAAVVRGLARRAGAHRAGPTHLGAGAVPRRPRPPGAVRGATRSRRCPSASTPGPTRSSRSTGTGARSWTS